MMLERAAAEIGAAMSRDAPASPAAPAAASIRTQINDRADDLTRIAAAACTAMRRGAHETALRDLARRRRR